MGEEGDYIPIATRHHQNDSCIKMGSDESYFNISLIVRDKVTRQCPQTTTFEERRAEAESNRGPSADQPIALPLGRTGSPRARSTPLPVWLRDVVTWCCRSRAAVPRQL